MYNKSKYNRTKFNKINSGKLTVDIVCNSFLDFNCRADYVGKIEELEAKSILEAGFRTVEMKSVTSLNVESKVQFAGGNIELSAESQFVNPLYTSKIESTTEIEVKCIRGSVRKANYENKSELNARAVMLYNGNTNLSTISVLELDRIFKISFIKSSKGSSSQMYAHSSWGVRIGIENVSDLEAKTLRNRFNKSLLNSSSFINARYIRITQGNGLEHIAYTAFSGRYIRLRILREKEYLATATMQADSSYIISDVFILKGLEFKPGDEIIIDMDNYLVLQNGENILKHLDDSSKFFDLVEGLNKIRYTDTSSSRSIEATISYNNRYI